MNSVYLVLERLCLRYRDMRNSSYCFVVCTYHYPPFSSGLSIGVS